jgi:hypothetical protein
MGHCCPKVLAITKDCLDALTNMDLYSRMIMISAIFILLAFLFADIAVLVTYFYIRRRKRKSQLLNFTLRQLRTLPLPNVESVLRDPSLQNAYPEAYRAIQIFTAFIREKRTKNTVQLSYYFQYMEGMVGNLLGCSVYSDEVTAVRRQVRSSQSKLLELSKAFVKASESGWVKDARNLLSQIDGEMLGYSNKLKELQTSVQSYRQREQQRLAREQDAALYTTSQTTNRHTVSPGGAYLMHQRYLDRIDSPMAFRDNIPGPLAQNQQYQQQYHGNSRPWGQPQVINPPVKNKHF